MDHGHRPLTPTRLDMAVAMAKEKKSVDAWTNHKLPKGARTLVLGVHRVIYVDPPRRTVVVPGKTRVQERINAFTRALPSVRWLLGELYSLGPASYMALRGLHTVLRLEITAKMYLNHRLLSMVCLIQVQDGPNPAEAPACR